MQILESSVLGLRSAVLTLRRRESPLRFVLFPMVHLGEQAFYDAVRERLRTCDVIVAEGVAGKSAPVSLLTAAYRFADRNPRLGLVVQSLRPEELGVPVVRPDMTGPEFTKRWKRLPIAQRLVFGTVAPAFGIGLRFFGTREFLGEVLALDDLPTPEYEAFEEDFAELKDVVLDQRDALLVDALAAIHEERHQEPIAVAVTYGAGHVPAVVQALFTRYRYIPSSAEWLTVFEY
jgi:hypothetical protein